MLVSATVSALHLLVMTCDGQVHCIVLHIIVLVALSREVSQYVFSPRSLEARRHQFNPQQIIVQHRYDVERSSLPVVYPVLVVIAQPKEYALFFLVVPASDVTPVVNVIIIVTLADALPHALYYTALAAAVRVH